MRFCHSVSLYPPFRRGLVMAAAALLTSACSCKPNDSHKIAGSALASAARAPAKTPRGPGVTAVVVPPSEETDPNGQGRELLGLGFVLSSQANAPFIRVDRFNLGQVIAASGAPITNVQLDGRDLVGSITRAGASVSVRGKDWVGATFEGKIRYAHPEFKQGLTLKVKVITSEQRATAEVNGGPQPPSSQRSWVYGLELEFDDGSHRPACEDPGDVAFPIPGYWDTTARYRRDTVSEFSFACVKKGVAKCLRKGYSAAGAAKSEGIELFEACTRMMRADYCGSGKSFTRDGSDVDVSDNKGIAAREGTAPATVTFEAAWMAGGVFCMARPRWQDLVPSVLTGDSACLAEGKHRVCKDEAAAKALLTGAMKNHPLVFNDSCEQHPCWHEKTGTVSHR